MVLGSANVTHTAPRRWPPADGAQAARHASRRHQEPGRPIIVGKAVAVCHQLALSNLQKSPMNSPGSSTYDPSVLSEEEKTRFQKALGDGFGHINRWDLAEESLPADLDPGLLEHQIYHDGTLAKRPKFWESRPNSVGYYTQCPINWEFWALEKYFAEQKAAYLAHLKSLDDYTCPDDQMSEAELAAAYLRDVETVDGYTWPVDPITEEDRIYIKALNQTYSKVWYEFHINSRMGPIYMLIRSYPTEPAPLQVFYRCTYYFGSLGRLIEQYYWKFSIEKAAIRGSVVLNGAKSGAARRASVFKDEHARWQEEADKIWKEDPSKLKKAVASAVKDGLHLDQTIGQIMRVLNGPKKLRKRP
jgi:hypothetical protein